MHITRIWEPNRRSMNYGKIESKPGYFSGVRCLRVVASSSSIKGPEILFPQVFEPSICRKSSCGWPLLTCGSPSYVPVLHKMWGDGVCWDREQTRGGSRPVTKYIDGAPRFAARVREDDGNDSLFPSLLPRLVEPWKSGRGSSCMVSGFGARRKGRYRVSLSQHGTSSCDGHKG